jgi:nicotinamide phosphoribosyltransferase
LKEEILARDGKLVIRPDSGDPVDIICGLPNTHTKHLTLPKNSPEFKGVIELLWDVFGGTVNEQGYKVLDSHIGAIYGDSITIDRAEQICSRLEAKGFASTNIVLGVGSFTYQFNTRDTFGFAMKATYVELEVPKFGELVDQNLNTEIIGREIFKDPITDDGTKKSATGLLSVSRDAFGVISLNDKVSWELEGKGLLHTIYKEGVYQNQTTLTQIREKLKQ